MSPKIQFTGRVIRRWKEQTKNGSELFYIAVTDDADTYPNIMKFKATSAEKLAEAKADATVTVTAFVNGREWTKEDGKKVYFTDLSLIEAKAVTKKSEPPAMPTEDASDPDELPF